MIDPRFERSTKEDPDTGRARRQAADHAGIRVAQIANGLGYLLMCAVVLAFVIMQGGVIEALFSGIRVTSDRGISLAHVAILSVAWLAYRKYTDEPMHPAPMILGLIWAVFGVITVLQNRQP